MSIDNQIANSSNIPSAAYQVDSDEISLKKLIFKLKEWWAYLLNQWRLIIFITLIGALLGLVYAWISKPIYKAELSFVLEDEKSTGGLGGALGLASQFGMDLGGGGGGGVFAGDNLLELMKSRYLVEKVLLSQVDERGRLIDYYLDFTGVRGKWNKDPSMKNFRFLPYSQKANFSRQQDSILGVFHKRLVIDNLSVSRLDKKLNIITVSVVSPDELFSKYFVEGITKEVSDFYIETKTKKATENLAILEYQTDSVRLVYNMAVSDVANSVDANPNANPALQILRVPSQRRQFDVLINQTILTQLIQNLEAAKVSLRKETPLIQIIDKPILPLEKKSFGKLRGIILGGLIAGSLILLILILMRIVKKATGPISSTTL
jgi:hypothetical protein